MTRLEIYKRYLEKLNDATLNDVPNLIDEFQVGNIDIGVYSYCGMQYACADYAILPGQSYDMIEMEGKLRKVLKIDNIKKTYNGLPCIRFYIHIEGYNLEPIHDLVVDFSDSDLSCIIQMDIDIARDTMDRCSLYRIIYPDGEHKLKPVRATGIFGCEKYFESMVSVDCSELYHARRLFINSGIKIFNFDDMNTHSLCYVSEMFYGCDELKEVKGKIRSKYTISARSMFSHCYELTDIGDDVFSGVKLSSADMLFYKCHKLKNNPLKPKNIEGINDIIGEIYSGCDNIDIQSVFNLLISKNKFNTPLRNVSGTFKAKKVRVTMDSLKGIFESSKFSIIDLSRVEFIGKNESVLGIFSLNDGALEWCRNNYNDTDDIDYTELFGFPNILIVNKTATVYEHDMDIFEIIYADGLSRDELKVRINMARMFGSNRRLLIVV